MESAGVRYQGAPFDRSERERTMDITPYLHLMIEKNASDLFFSTGAPANIKIDGTTRPVDKNVLPPGAVKKLAYSVMTDEQISEFESIMEMNLAISARNMGRFRVNVYRQRGEVAMVVRYIKGIIPSVEELNLPPIVKSLIMEPRGLILVVGATGSGKSTTLASMIDFRNANKTGHIVTIEDPIEFIHRHKLSIIDQREIGIDTLSYSNALKNALREAPDVILVGEVRDREAMQHALTLAETGHLCLTTLHASNAYQALDRVINFFPESARTQLLLDLSFNLRAVVSQRLVLGQEGKRMPAVEVLLNTPYVSELIQKGEIDGIREAMEQGVDRGMQTFDQALYVMYKEGKISLDEALDHADSRNNLGLRIRLAEGAKEAPWDISIGRETFKFD
jgi:twitching motility protein PilU